MLAFLKSIFSRRPDPGLVVIKRDPFRLTIDEWRSSPELCKQAAMALGNPVVRQMVDCLRTSHLAFYSTSGHSTAEERAERFSMAEGYGIALNNLEALAHYEPLKQPLEETFEPPDREEH